MEKHQQQIQRELEHSRLSLENFTAQAERSPGYSATGHRFIRDKLGAFVIAVEELRQCAYSSCHAPAYGVFLNMIDPGSTALITLREVIQAYASNDNITEVRTSNEAEGAIDKEQEFEGDTDIGDKYTFDPKLTNLAKKIGSRCELNWRLLEPKEKNKVVSRYVQRYTCDRKKKEHDIRILLKQKWSVHNNDIRLGLELIKLASAEPEPNLLKITRGTAIGTKERPNIISLNEFFASELDHAKDQLAYLATPVFRPMICPPKDWEDSHGGGYLTHFISSDLVKHWGNLAIRDGIKRAEAQNALAPTIDAVNALQKTPWRINQDVYKVMKHAVELSSAKKRFRLPYFDSSLGKKARAHCKLRYALRLAAAEDVLNEERFYFPYCLDYRGRAYCQPQALNYQMDDIGRSLLEFADPKPLGESGVKWLSVHLANCWGAGEDKRSFADRWAWVKNNTPEILLCAEDPIKNQWWLKADKPWRFLAACFDYKSVSEHGAQVLSYLPVAVDGTCNGFQHISALRRDKVGARLTNLSCSERPEVPPEDLYTEVANLLMSQVREKAEAGDTRAQQFLSKAPKQTRDIVKKAVMATPYGITSWTVSNNFQQQDFLKSFKALEKKRISSFLSTLLMECIQEIMDPGDDFTKWFRGLAEQLAKDNLPIQWTTPNGFPVVQAEWKRKKTKIGTGRPSMTIFEPIQPRVLDVKSQGRKVVANFIHSLDAAHLVSTIRRLSLEMKLSHFGAVHDCYAVHGCDVDILKQVLREEFVKLHEFLDLSDFPNTTVFSADRLKLNKPPKRGEFNINEVLKSQYLFS